MKPWHVIRLRNFSNTLNVLIMSSIMRSLITLKWFNFWSPWKFSWFDAEIPETPWIFSWFLPPKRPWSVGAEHLEMLRSSVAAAEEPFILRRLKRDPAIAADLPDKVEQTHECEMSTKQRTGPAASARGNGQAKLRRPWRFTGDSCFFVMGPGGALSFHEFCLQPCSYNITCYPLRVQVFLTGISNCQPFWSVFTSSRWLN